MTILPVPRASILAALVTCSLVIGMTWFTTGIGTVNATNLVLNPIWEFGYLLEGVF